MEPELDPTSTQARLYVSARRAFERARVGIGVRLALPALAVTLLSMILHGIDAGCVGVGCVLCTAMGLSGWHGGAYAEVATPALAAGLVPFLAPLATATVGHVCVGDSCMSICLLACGVGGFVAGFSFAARVRPRGRAWLSGALILTLTGTLGCAFAGAPGLLGMMAGGVVGAVPAAMYWARA